MKYWVRFGACFRLVVAGWLLGAYGQSVVSARDYKLGVLQIESDEVHDDELGPAFMEQLRAVLADRTDITPVDTRVSLTQLSLGQDCNTAEASCLQSIAEHLQVDGFLFGKLAREGGEPVAIMRRYDTQSASIRGSALATFGARTTTTAAMRHEVEKMVSSLLGGRQAQEAPVAKLAPSDVAAATSSEDSGGGSFRQVAGFTLLGVSVVSVGLSVLSFVLIHDAENNQGFSRYRVAVGQNNTNVEDVCAEAQAGRRYELNETDFQSARSACSRGATFEILQYVFLGTAVVTGGFATFLLLGGGDEEAPTATAQQRWRLRPQVGRSTLGLTADLRF